MKVLLLQEGFIIKSTTVDGLANRKFYASLKSSEVSRLLHVQVISSSRCALVLSEAVVS